MEKVKRINNKENLQEISYAEEIIYLYDLLIEECYGER